MIPYQLPKFQTFSSNTFWDILRLIFSKGHNSRQGDNSDKKKKKKQISYISMRNPYMKFQNPSIHSSYDMAYIKKRDGSMKLGA